MPFFEDFGNDFHLDHGRVHPNNSITAMHIHPSYEALLVLDRAKQTTKINGQILPTISQPSLTICAPFSMHQTNMEFDSRIERCAYYFGETLIQQTPYVFENFVPYEHAVYSRFLISDELLQQLTPSIELIRSQKKDPILMKLTFLSIFYLILQKAPLESIHQETGTLAEISKIIKYMADHCCENISSETVCHAFSISRSKLTKDFNKYLSISFHQLLTEMRISQACYRLRAKDSDIKSVAQALGFEKDTYFYTFFKKETGMTPMQFKKSNKPYFPLQPSTQQEKPLPTKN